VITYLKNKNLLDNREIFVYATAKRTFGGAVGAVQGLVLITVFHDILYIFCPQLNNMPKECLGRFYISDLREIKGKAGLFGGDFSFIANGKKYDFRLPSRSKKFVDYFKN